MIVHIFFRQNIKQMKKWIYIIRLFHFWLAILAFCFCSLAQDGMQKRHELHDSIQVKEWFNTGRSYFFSNPDSSIFYISKALELARKTNDNLYIALCLNSSGESNRIIGNFPQALGNQYEALDMYRKIGNIDGEIATLTYIGNNYLDLSEYRKGLNYLLSGEKKYKQYPENFHSQSISNNRFLLSSIGFGYEKMGNLDSALIYQNQALLDPLLESETTPVKSLILRRLGNVKFLLGRDGEALEHYQQALENANTRGFTLYLDHPNISNGISEVFLKRNGIDSAIYYAKQAYMDGKKIGKKDAILNASQQLTKIYKSLGVTDSAFYYQEISIMYRDSLYGMDKLNQLQLLILQQQEQQQKVLLEKETIKNRSRMIALSAFLLILFVTALLLYRNNNLKHKAKIRIEKAYKELKETQNQLIQSEKMASLGQLTAGIAHEIQNPLNFVNNFSEVNIELVEELRNDLDKVKTQYITSQHITSQPIDLSNMDDAESILNDLKSNQQKINNHGRRASDIVKSMLLHSRASSDQKELTDLNALADEYLRLSYHGLRANDQSFNADFKTDFDPNVPKINVVPQDMGRVLLNLINNAFQACTTGGEANPKPTVTVKTAMVKSRSGNLEIEISVKDNGPGIPDHIKDKIFQPFFTTKPTGQGTGLGLSLSYDIVKAHGGELKLVSTPADEKGSIFIIKLKVD